jgi:glycosyltransferase involved in cell wall biosynthesis
MGALLQKVSCIIPFFNEKEYIRQVLKAIRKADGISQVICVDDGSTDNTSEIVIREFSEVKLIQLEKNQGKSFAVKKGLEEVISEYVLLIDADLRDLNAGEISCAIDAIIRYNHIDMIILRRWKAPWFIKLYRIDTLLSGERLLKAEDLQRIFSSSVTGYQLEIAINLYMNQNNKKVFWYPSSALNTFKFQKFSPFKAIAKEMGMYASLVQHAGFINLIILLMRFGKEKLPE